MLDEAQLPLPLDLAPPLALAAPSEQRRTRLATTRAAKPDPGPAAERIVARPAPSACEAAMLRAARRVYLNLATHWSLTGREALVLLGELPGAKRILGDKGYDADWLRDALKARGLRICIPARRGRRSPASHNKLYKKRCRIENAFARLKDWRGIATRYTRCGDLLLSAICLAATILFWLPK